MTYDKDNVFYKIIHKEIPSNIIVEGENYIAIHDIAQKAPVHVLVIPKGEYVDWYDFVERATSDEVLDFNNGINKIITMMNLTRGGYKLISNSGKFGMQQVPHFHVHVMGQIEDQ
jgi:histidine triad (HIT) family protein